MTPAQHEAAIEAAQKLTRRLIEARMAEPYAKAHRLESARQYLETIAIAFGLEVKERENA